MTRVVNPPALPRYTPASPSVAEPISKLLFVLIGMLPARDPSTVISSGVPFPSVTAPFNVAEPAHVKASIENDLVPSVIELMMSVKFWVTCVASAVVPLVNVYVTEGLAKD